ncbi:MAG: ribosome biogenesis GTPase Der [Spirochaetaceae bacterium]|jgi:GTP-binding protein|nr:ribosome biogenesis GTPase Der [Spirochaetaceae bacterium]
MRKTETPLVRYQNLPVVVIAGRPNVGKSTLFNRLIGRRRSITGPLPGLTRDPVAEDAVILEKPVRLVDTGGFKLDRAGDEAAESIDELVVDRALSAIENASAVVLLLEAGNITAEDEDFIKTLRPLRGKLIAAVNKTEGGRKVEEAWNLLSYGFETIHMISAEHGDNIEELKKAIISKLDFSKLSAAEAEDGEVVRITLTGKPNTGKSTLSNRLTASSASIVSPIPGCTRDVVEGEFLWNGRRFLVCDTAGIRRKTKVTEDVEYFSVNRAIKTMDEADIVVILIDAREGLSEQDKKIAALACERGRGVIFLLNKWDMTSGLKNEFTAVCDKIRYFFGKMSWAPILAASALTGEGVDKFLQTCVKMRSELLTRVDTAVLNDALERWQAERPPPSGPLTRFKIKYGVQISANPVVFRLFASRPEACKESYVSYLQRKMRSDLGFSSIPLRVEIKRSGREPERRRKNSGPPSAAKNYGAKRGRPADGKKKDGFKK